jgi:hypothetical protein
MLYCLAQVKTFFQKLFCTHSKKRQVFQGRCYYEKGNRERRWYYGKIYVCERCNEEFFVWDTLPRELKNQIAR